jgi:hypothetical protein
VVYSGGGPRDILYTLEVGRSPSFLHGRAQSYDPRGWHHNGGRGCLTVERMNSSFCMFIASHASGHQKSLLGRLFYCTTLAPGQRTILLDMLKTG